MPILECKHLSKRFGAIQALDNVDLTVEPGRIVGLLGPNGSGKTTLIKLANGLLTPPGGEILISRAVADILGDRAKVTSLGSSIKLKGKAEGFEVLTLDHLK